MWAIITLGSFYEYFSSRIRFKIRRYLYLFVHMHMIAIFCRSPWWWQSKLIEATGWTTVANWKRRHEWQRQSLTTQMISNVICKYTIECDNAKPYQPHSLTNTNHLWYSLMHLSRLQKWSECAPVFLAVLTLIILVKLNWSVNYPIHPE